MSSSVSRLLFIDIETYSETDLLSAGVYKYVEDPTFEVLIFAYAWDKEPVIVIDLKKGEELPDDIRRALVDPSIAKLAHNANFERTGLAKHTGVPMDPEQWTCTSVMASVLGLPRSLDEVGKAIGLPKDLQKMKAGKALISYFSKPCKPTDANGARTRNLPHHDPERWDLYKKYCGQDVETERSIFKRLIEYPSQPTREKELWDLDQRINDAGVRIERRIVDHIIAYNEDTTLAMIERAKEITGIDNPNSLKQLKEWLSDQGIETDSLNKDAVKELIGTSDDKVVTELLQIRQGLGKTSVSKYDAMSRAVCKDHRIRGMLQFYGANRSGRWSGKIVQLQNLPQNHMKDLDIARQTIIDNDFELLEILYDDIQDVFSQLIRTALIPAPEHTFLVADYSAIEARVIAWLAEEKWAMEVFATHGKIYEATAAQMFRVPISSIVKGSMERQKGKVAVLALGYQGSVGALEAMGGADIGLSEDEMKTLVKQWRASNPNIVNLWKDTEEKVRKAILTNNPEYGPRGIVYYMHKDTLIIKLPSGRFLAYKNAQVVKTKTPMGTKNEIRYEGVNQDTGRWGLVNTYGGKLVENMVQAIARDCLAEALLRLAKEGYRASFHVHDEVVLEVKTDRAEKTMTLIKSIMSLADLKWAKDLTLTADAYTTEYYQKD